MDKIEIHQNFFIEFKTEDSDITILPLEVNVDFLARLRTGPMFLYGATQEVSGEMLDASIRLK